MDHKLKLLTDSTANCGMYNRWTRGAVQAGRFSLKKISTYSNVNDLTTENQERETDGVDEFGETTRQQRTRGRSLDGQRRADIRGECCA